MAEMYFGKTAVKSAAALIIAAVIGLAIPIDIIQAYIQNNLK